MARRKADLLIVNAEELLTLKGAARPRTGEELRELGALKDGAVAVKDGGIVAVGGTDDIRDEFGKANVVLDARGKLVMPGFVDCHNHLVFAGSRENELEMKLQGMSYADIARRGGGIMSTVTATREASPGALVRVAVKRLDQMLRFGTTTSEAKSGYGLNLEDEVKMLEAVRDLMEVQPIELVPTFMGAHALPPEFRDYDGYTKGLTDRIIPAVAGKKLAEFCDVFCDRGFFSVEQAREILRKAAGLGMRAKLHADELANVGGAELAAELGAVSAEHLNRASEKGLSLMARKGVIAVLLPASSYAMMGSGHADARKMIDLGVPVALGTDLCPNSWTESMQLAVSFACHFNGILPSEAISAATINAAHALGRGGRVGSLEEGKQADIIILDVPNHRHVPYHFGVNLVERVVKRGKVVV